ncbi:MAG: hypothetical protein IJW95_02475 [Clostridia bacterium]|jgi:hypothetical protein|nr:hypothetical protein [Clostridia bacterium]
MDNEESEQEDSYSSRLRILAVRVLGYTHTEFGMRPLHKILTELEQGLGVKNKTENNAGDDGVWIDEEVI